MSDFLWRPAGSIKVPDPQSAAWTPVLDYLASNRLYRIKVKNPTIAAWTLEGAAQSCLSDGSEISPRSGDPVCPGSPYGALIAKLGGGTADRAGTIFPIGRYCVYKVTDPVKPGPLYLGVNDQFEWMTKVHGQIEVEIEVSLGAPPA